MDYRRSISNGFNETLPASNLTSNRSAFSDYIHPNPFSINFIRNIFIALYTGAFLLCVIGNSLVILVVVRHRKMRTTTNIFLGNLAGADLCVGVFCIIPSLMQHMSSVWILGKVMCKLLHFVQMMSYVASILTLSFIALERHVAIIHPIHNRAWKRLWCLQVAVLAIWVLASASGLPQLVYRDTWTAPNGDAFCYINSTSFNRQAYVITNFFLWYLLPLFVMLVMYSKISIVLWKASVNEAKRLKGQKRGIKKRSRVEYKPASRCMPPCPSNSLAINTCNTDIRIILDDAESDSCPACLTDNSLEKLENNSKDPSLNEVRLHRMNQATGFESDSPAKRTCSLKDIIPNSRGSHAQPNSIRHSKAMLEMRHSDSSYVCIKSNNTGHVKGRRGSSAQPTLADMDQSRNSGLVLLARRRVIRLLMTVALSFAICVLPYHIQMIITEWCIETITFSHVLSNIISIFLFYFNSAINPVLYAFLSENFRKSLKDIISCRRPREQFEV